MDSIPSWYTGNDLANAAARAGIELPKVTNYKIPFYRPSKILLIPHYERVDHLLAKSKKQQTFSGQK